MVLSTTVYTGQKRCEITHEPSHSTITTDAPKDNNGLGAAFSPTDLVGAALGSCIVTTLAIVAERDGLVFDKAHAKVEKHMQTAPVRKIAKLITTVFLPASLTPDQRKKFEHIAHTCPVHRSLSSDIEMPIEFVYE